MPRRPIRVAARGMAQSGSASALGAESRTSLWQGQQKQPL